MPRDLAPVIPSAVKVTFVPKKCSGTGDIPAIWTETVQLSDTDVPGLESEIEGKGVKVFHDKAPALFVGGGTTPTNSAQLASLAKRIAADAWSWRASGLDRVYNGIVAFKQDGIADTVEWTYRAGRATTRANNGTLNGDPEELHHVGTDCDGVSCVEMYEPPIYIVGSERRIKKINLCHENGKLVKSSSGYDVVQGCCGGGGCTVTLTVNANTCPTATGGVLIELLDEAGTTVLGSGLGTSKVFAIDGTLKYKIRLTKSGYCTRTIDLGPVGCVGTLTRNYSIWPSTFQVDFFAGAIMAGGLLCGIPNTSITVTGDVTGSGTTGSDGHLILTFNSSCDDQNQTFTYTSVPPASQGIATPVPVTHTYDLCVPGPYSQTVFLGPKAGHSVWLFNHRYIPSSLTYSDDYISGTIVNAGTPNYWQGVFTYNSAHGIGPVSCDPVFPNNKTGLSDQSGVVTVAIEVWGIQPQCDEPLKLRVYRNLQPAQGWTSCAMVAKKTQPLLGAPQYARHPFEGTGDGTQTIVGTAISLSVAVGAQVIFDFAGNIPVEETAVNATIVGTIG